jgi:hypothetical protein
MRRIPIVAAAALVVLSLSGEALAANVYTVDGSAKPRGKGSPKKPRPIALKFDFQVESDNPAVRGTPIETFAIGSEGLVTYPELFPKCTYSQANRDGSPSRKCRRAKIGSGLVQNLVGPAASPTVKIFCNLRLTLYNISGAGRHGGMAIRLDGDPKEPPLMSPDDRSINCPTPLHGAIKARFKPRRIAGVRSDELRFDVPAELLHPSGLDTTVRNTISKIGRKVRKKKIRGKRRKVGYYSSVGCKGRKRTIRATFTDEQGRKFTATRARRC